MTSPTLVHPRPPRQERTRAGWERILATGLELLNEGGWEALTIAEVCRRAGVTAPSIYARVDGRAGLFSAVYEHGMMLVERTEREAFGDLSRSDDDRVEAVVGAFVEIFVTHEAFLRAVIRYSSSNPPLLQRGSEEAQRITRLVARALPFPPVSGLIIGRLLFSECLVRVMYGETFYDSRGESRKHFVAHLTRIAKAIGTDAKS